MSQFEKKYAIIDTFSLLFRFYYAMPELRTRSGTPTGMLVGLTNFFLHLFKDFEFTGYMAVLDTSKKTFRHDMYEAYKANRTEAPEDFVTQIPLAFELIDLFMFPKQSYDRYEADDLAGTFARVYGADNSIQVTCITSDMDYLQLVTPNVRVYSPRVGFRKAKIYTPDEVVEKWKVTPAQVADFKGLKGDPSDNIPGVPGIGDKTAAKLLNEFNDLEEIYAGIETLQGKVKETLLSHRHEAFLSRDLATIRTDLDLDIPDSLDFVHKNIDFDALEDFLQKYECFSGLRKIQAYRKSLFAEKKLVPSKIKEDQMSLF